MSNPTLDYLPFSSVTSPFPLHNAQSLGTRPHSVPGPERPSGVLPSALGGALLESLLNELQVLQVTLDGGDEVAQAILLVLQVLQSQREKKQEPLQGWDFTKPYVRSHFNLC